MDEKYYYLPRHLDEPYKVVYFTIDECVLLLIPVLIGMFCFDAPIYAICVGATLVAGLKKLKGKEGHYFIYSLAYWHFPEIIKFKSTPPSYVREILG